MNDTRFGRILVRCATLLICGTWIPAAIAASFVVLPDREMVRQATAIVIASPLNSRTELRDGKIIETVTVMSVEEVLKGSMRRDTFEVYEPGGVYEKRISTIPGIPRFKDGDRYVLFLIRTPEGIWRVLNLVLGKFTFTTDVFGHEVLLRDANEIAGWDPDGKPHQETNRAAEAFVDFIRGSARGGPAREDYLIKAEPLIDVSANLTRRGIVRPTPLCVFPCSPTTYTYDYFNGNGARWNVFPSGVNYFYRGANAAAITALNNGIASWNNDASSNVNLVNAGADPGSHTGGVNAPDGQNTVAFEKDLVSEYGAMAFSCSSMSYGGTLGVGAVTSDAGTHVGPNSETFYTSAEGDVEMNQGLSTCAFFIGLGDFNSAVAHELGHTLGFRHADQTRASLNAPACSGDATLECSSSAIMKAFIPSGLNGALQTWDQHAVVEVYPNPVISPPTGVEAHAITSSTIRVTWTTVGGATSYRVYRSANNSTYTLVGSPMSPPFDDSTAPANAAYLYKVHSFDGSNESGDSNKDLASLVTLTNTLTPTVTTVNALDFTEVRNAVNKVETLAGIANTAYTDPTLDSSVTVKKVHIDEPLTRLNTARSNLGFSTISLTGGAITAQVTPIRASDITDLRAGTQ
jgi:hypothetical protein